MARRGGVMARGTFVTCDGIHGGEIPFIDGIKTAQKYGWTSFNSNYDTTCMTGVRKDLCPLCSTIFLMMGLATLCGYESDSRFRFYMWDLMPDGIRDWSELYPSMYLGRHPIYIRSGVMGPFVRGDGIR